MELWEIDRRFQEWCRYSEIIIKIHPKLFEYSLGLAQIDKTLITDDDRFVAHFQETKNCNSIAIDLGHHITISEFWVFAAYEFLRTLDEMCRDNSSLFTAPKNKEINNLKKYFLHIRIPLAKLEPATPYKNTDYDVVNAEFSCDGISWKVSDQLTISRLELSNKIYCLLETLNEDYI